jgi:hypothetical protein
MQQSVALSLVVWRNERSSEFYVSIVLGPEMLVKAGIAMLKIGVISAPGWSVEFGKGNPGPTCNPFGLLVDHQ